MYGYYLLIIAKPWHGIIFIMLLPIKYNCFAFHIYLLHHLPLTSLLLVLSSFFNFLLNFGPIFYHLHPCSCSSHFTFIFLNLSSLNLGPSSFLPLHLPIYLTLCDLLSLLLTSIFILFSVLFVFHSSLLLINTYTLLECIKTYLHQLFTPHIHPHSAL